MLQPVEIHLSRVSSTSDYARELLRHYPFVMVTAEMQTHGRGRKGRAWQSEHGMNALCSIAIQHEEDQPSNHLALWMGRAAIAVMNTIVCHTKDASIRLKYPNDVQCLENATWSKISGILVEHEFLGAKCTSTTVGIGINVTQRLFSDTIQQPCTSLHRIGSTASVHDVLNTLKHRFVEALYTDPLTSFSKWNDAIVSAESRIVIGQDGHTYTAERLLDDGRLLLRQTDTNQERIASDGDSLQYLD